jgi:type I restriction enzyme S subunit
MEAPEPKNIGPGFFFRKFWIFIENVIIMNRYNLIKEVLTKNASSDYLTQIAHLPPDEQQKIKDTITSIDHIIELQTQKLELLKQHRKGLIQKLVPNINK